MPKDPFFSFNSEDTLPLHFLLSLGGENHQFFNPASVNIWDYDVLFFVLDGGFQGGNSYISFHLSAPISNTYTE